MNWPSASAPGKPGIPLSPRIHPDFYSDLARAQRNKLAAEAAQIAATEKARAAAQEQARLAAEGAKASEQAKAAALSNAAEGERLAAEKNPAGGREGEEARGSQDRRNRCASGRQA